jgi:hypothetical protein
MADDAARNSAHLAVPCDMTRDAPNDRTFDTSLRLGGDWSKRYAQNGGQEDQRLHGGSPKKTVAATIRVAAISSQNGHDIPPIAGVIQPSRIRQSNVMGGALVCARTTLFQHQFHK